MNVFKMTAGLLLLVLAQNARADKHWFHNREPRHAVLVQNYTHYALQVRLADREGRDLGLAWTVGPEQRSYLAQGSVLVSVSKHDHIITGDGMRRIEDVAQYVDGHWEVRYWDKHHFKGHHGQHEWSKWHHGEHEGRW